MLATACYKPLTERSLVETERLIERTLRMSYETFTSSSYVQQGRADSFTTTSPAERKRILAEILELGYYDELEGRAKERFKTREAQLADERRLAEDWEREIARRPEYQAEVDRLRVALAAFDKQVTELEEQTTAGAKSCDAARSSAAAGRGDRGSPAAPEPGADPHRVDPGRAALAARAGPGGDRPRGGGRATRDGAGRGPRRAGDRQRTATNVSAPRARARSRRAHAGRRAGTPRG